MSKISFSSRARNDSNWLYLMAILVCCLAIITVPIFVSGFPLAGDLAADLRFADAYKLAIAHFDFFPGWANDNLGFGSIGIRFYPPLVFYLSVLAETAFGNWYDAFSINLLGWMFVGCAGVYFFVKEFSSRFYAMLAGMLYSIVPYHLIEIYQFFLYAEFAAFALLPFTFLYVTRLCLHRNWMDAVLFAISYSLLILTHIPLTIITTLSLPMYVLVVLDWRQLKDTLAKLAVSLLLSLAATASYLVRIISEIQWLAHSNPQYTSGFYDYSTWLFPNILEKREVYAVYIYAWLFDITIILTVFLILPGIIYLIKRRAQEDRFTHRVLLAVTTTALFAGFMLSRPSSLIWQSAGFLQKIQFPWRWLSLLSMFGVVSLGLSIPLLVKRYDRVKRLVIYPTLCIVIAIVFYDVTQSITQSIPLSREVFMSVANTLSSRPSYQAWWPIWAKKEAFANTEKVTAENRSVDIASWEAEEREFTVGEGDPANVRVATFYYPYWKATVNDRPTEVKMDENGVILIPIGNEAAKVHLYFDEPFIDRMALWVSLATWAGLLIVLGVYVKRKIFSTLQTI